MRRVFDDQAGPPSGCSGPEDADEPPIKRVAGEGYEHFLWQWLFWTKLLILLDDTASA